MKIKNIDELLKHYECETLEELWEYIENLEAIKDDYEYLKNQVNDLCLEMQDLY